MFPGRNCVEVCPHSGEKSVFYKRDWKAVFIDIGGTLREINSGEGFTEFKEKSQ